MCRASMLRARKHALRAASGSATPDPERTTQNTAADYQTFAQEVLGAVRPSVVANSQGSVFALALALEGQLERLVLVSPADEVAHPDIYAMLPAEATALSDLAQEDPDRAALILQGFSAQAMESMVFDGIGGGNQVTRSVQNAHGPGCGVLPKQAELIARGPRPAASIIGLCSSHNRSPRTSRCERCAQATPAPSPMHTCAIANI